MNLRGTRCVGDGERAIRWALVPIIEGNTLLYRDQAFSTEDAGDLIEYADVALEMYESFDHVGGRFSTLSWNTGQFHVLFRQECAWDI